MNNNQNTQQRILGGFKTMENLNPRQSYQDGTEDEIVSFQDDMDNGTSNIFIKNKELPFLENDKSITVDNDYDDDNTLTGGKHNTSKKLNNSQMDRSNLSNLNNNNNNNNININIKSNTMKKNTNADLMKYISDSSDFFERPMMNQGKNLITFSNNMNTHPNEKNYIDGDFEEDDNIPNNMMNHNLGEYINNKNNNPLFSSDGLGIIQPLETKIEDHFLLENNQELNLYTGSPSFNEKKGKNTLAIETFNLTFFNTIGNSLLSTQSFGLTHSKMKEKEYMELENNYNEVLNLLKYWQQFYLDIAKIVTTQQNQNKSVDENDYFSEEFRFNVIEEVKNLIKNARMKVYNYFEPIHIENLNYNSFKVIPPLNIEDVLNFEILRTEIEESFNQNNKELNRMFDYLEEISENNLFFEKKISIKIPKILDYNDYYDELPPLQFSEREKMMHSKQEKKKSKDFENDSKTLTIDQEPERKIELVDEETQTTLTTQITQTIELPPTRGIINLTSPSNNNNGRNSRCSSTKNSNSNNSSYVNLVNYKFNKDKLKLDSMNKISLNFVSKPLKRNVSPNPIQNKAKVNNSTKKVQMITHSSESQTDFTLKNIQNLEILNKEYSIQLQRTQKEKENLKKTYDKKITELTNELEEAKSQQKETKEDNKDDDTLNESHNDGQVSYLPELIPPEQTYKIFMHALKHFKYEEKIYKSLIEEEDLNILKSFVNKMDKYILGTSIPCQRTPKPNNMTVHKIPKTLKNSSMKMYHENILNGIRPLISSTTKNQYNKNHLYSAKRNNSSFMKYKNAIKNIHDNN